jgi:hypothetical protein
MSKWAARALLTLALAGAVGACTGAGISTGATDPTAQRGSEYWERLNADKSHMRYDYPGPPLTGGCVC